MKNYIIICILISLVLFGLNAPVTAQVVTEEEALTVAKNWIYLIIQLRGDWGGSDYASVADIREFNYGEQTVGYFCQVRPKGFIILSSHKALPPVKAYSADSDMAPDSTRGMVDFVKGNMKQVLDAFEKHYGAPERVQAVTVEQTLETNYSQVWQLLQHNVGALIDQKKGGDAITMNYQEGDVLLYTSWDQLPPYNYQCPEMNCMWMEDGYHSTNARVGCVATAGAQIMRYWSWPPYGNGSYNGVSFSDTYDWSLMANRYVYAPMYPSGFVDETGKPVTQAQINAVAELCHEIGVANDMEYTCDLSDGSTRDMSDVYANYFRYDQGDVINRSDCGKTTWFNHFKDNININRPVQYRMVTPGGNNHSVAVDGWQDIGGIRQIHINYGHDDGDTQWYTLDDLDRWDRNDSDGNSNLDDQLIVTSIRPLCSLGNSLLSIRYPKNAFPYRYFDQDATGRATEFASGQYLQFLQNITVSANSDPASYIYFVGQADATRLYTRGDPSRGVRIDNGKIKLMNGGSIRFQ